MPVSLNTLHAFVDWFVPAELAADREMRKQARLFLISHLLGPFLGNVVPISLYVLDPHPGFEVAVLAISITSFWIFPPLLRMMGRYYNLLALISIQNLIFCILWSCYFYGGVTSPTLPWVLTIPLLAFFYIGSSPSLRLVVLAMFVVNFTGFCLLYFDGNVPEVGIPFAALQGLGLVSTAAASAYVIMMALFYAKAVASQSEMEGEMRGHLNTAAELRRAATEAERASVAKADFLAKMSHELRTPLNAVIGYSQMLLEEAEDERDTESVADLERIHTAGQQLLRLVNDILDLSKIEAGKMDIFSEDIQFIELVEEAIAGVQALASRNGNRIAVHYETAIGVITCDARKARHVLFQVLENAAKLTRDGSIDVRCNRRETAHGGEVLVIVRDTGIGIPPEQIHGLFEQFAVADDSSSTKYGGTGLGLALSQKLCRLMGGDVTVESTLNVGSCFTIILPAMPLPEVGDQASGAILADEAGVPATQGGHAGDVAARVVKPAQPEHQKVLVAANA
jgi:signal transduction histidine kinase